MFTITFWELVPKRKRKRKLRLSEQIKFSYQPIFMHEMIFYFKEIFTSTSYVESTITWCRIEVNSRETSYML